MIRRHSVFALLLSVCVSLHAVTVEIDGVCYGITGPYAYVTSRSLTGPEQNSYVGDVVVREKISYNGQSFNVISVAANAFAGCEELTSVSLPSSVRAISPNAFLGCTGLREVSFTPTLGTISCCAFTACTSLQQISLPRKTEVVDTLTFYCCASLKSLILPHRVRTVCWGALEHIPAMTDLYCYASLPPVTEVGAFTRADQQKCTLHVPRETIHLYRKASIWGDFYNIVPLKDSEYLALNYQKGDINDDGKVDAEDLDLLRRIIVSLPDDSAVHWAGDINGDGKVNAADYVLLAKSISFSAEEHEYVDLGLPSGTQ